MPKASALSKPLRLFLILLVVTATAGMVLRQAQMRSLRESLLRMGRPGSAGPR